MRQLTSLAFIAHPGFKYCTALKLSLNLTVGQTNGGGEEGEYKSLLFQEFSVGLDFTNESSLWNESNRVYLLTCTKAYGFRTVIYLWLLRRDFFLWYLQL